MNRVAAYLIRFAVIIGGYAVSALSASAFLNLLTLASLGFTADEAPAMALGSVVFSIPFIALFVAYFAFVPSAVAILISEIFTLRDWLYHALAGAVVAGVVIGVFRGAAEAGNEAVADPRFALGIIGGGICGGIGYWLVAGRTAGSWREPARDVTSRAP
ncbi:MAG: hypothetical protein NTV73_01730 [Hyphomicrobiales bacterium]|nr:hypothetical protein [Hyphomicrobiales bacterium]